MINQQIPMKAEKTSGEELLVHSIFDTIQGEGIFAGRPALFLRLGGCNLQCPNCDTEYTDKTKKLTIKQIIELIHTTRSDNTNLVVITGGEPFRQSLGVLIHKLTEEEGLLVQVETNGTLFDASIDYNNPRLFIMCSPKTGAVNKKLQPFISAYKYVGGANELSIPYEELMDHHNPRLLEDHSLMPDGLPRQALGHTAKPFLARPHEGFTGEVFLQPIDRQDDYLNSLHTKAVVESCIANGYRLCLQLHKFIGVE